MITAVATITTPTCISPPPTAMVDTRIGQYLPVWKVTQTLGIKTRSF